MRGIDKTMTPIGDRPMILHTVKALEAADCITELLIVTREDLIEPIRDLCALCTKPVQVIQGGASRAESVLKGLRACRTELCAIHDGARPFASVELIEGAVVAGRIYGAAAPAVPVRDTIKLARDGIVTQTPDRATLFAVQTPQVFYTATIIRAITEAMEKNIPLTDDCSAAESFGMEVHLTPGSEENLKITTPVDLIFAEAILKGRDET
ncbi:MAG: 2-C-methyl-D-erythritol 4-phosphate cytidylyltransferase [Oscillospiraceae bacterium]|nr:2-C-methyl-D-erythritol 4-phosphate cytidylyltransferase [Oscillospiraceae bacterium]